MLNKIKPQPKSFKSYKRFVNHQEFLAIKKLAKELSKLKVIHISSTGLSEGGGVAQMLHSLIPLFNSLGIKSDWYTFTAPVKFFEITKQIHNSLQGSQHRLSQAERDYYLKINKQLAIEINKLKCKILVIHDPQPIAVVSYLKKLQPKKKILRLHLDLSRPNKKTFNFLAKYLNFYDKIILSSFDYVYEGLDYNKLMVCYPAIDPLSVKNKPLAKAQAKKILKELGININQPLITQVSRFDPWKDPVGVVDIYYQLKKEIPSLQLAYMGIIEAKDDPEAIRILEQIRQKVGNDKKIFLFSEVEQLQDYPIDLVVNAFQVASDVILQKSLREGFGLTVTEAMWQKNPVVAGNVGGIRLQITDGQNGFLINNKKQAAEKVLWLLKNKRLRKKMGEQAKQSVRKKFLITRLVHDYLKLFSTLS